MAGATSSRNGIVPQRSCATRRPSTRPGHGHGERAVQIAVLDHRRPAEQVAGHPTRERIGGGIEAARRDHAAVDRVDGAVGEAQQHAAAPAQPAHPRLEHAKRQGGRDRRVDRVAAGAQHLGTDRRGFAMLRRHQPAAASGPHACPPASCPAPSPLSCLRNQLARTAVRHQLHRTERARARCTSVPSARSFGQACWRAASPMVAASAVAASAMAGRGSAGADLPARSRSPDRPIV